MSVVPQQRKSVCKANLIKTKVVEQKVLSEISFLIDNNEILSELLKELNRDTEKVNETFIADKKHSRR